MEVSVLLVQLWAMRQIFEYTPIANLATNRSARTHRDAITKELKKIHNGGQSANETARFQKVEKLMET